MAGNLKQLIRVRQTYTNEGHSQAWAAIRSLSPHSPLIPVASPAQAEFEAAILGRIGYGLCPQDLGSGVRQPFGIVSVIPRVRELIVSLGDCEDALAEFVAKIAPCVHEDLDFSGVEGIRARFTRSGVILHRLHVPGRIVLRGVSEADWNSALETGFADADILGKSYMGSRTSLHDTERWYIDKSSHRRDLSPNIRVAHHILSGLLRRLHLFRARSQMRFTDLWFNLLRDGAVINIEWAGDLPHLDVISRITDRRFGLPLEVHEHDGCCCEPCMVGEYSITMRDSITKSVILHLRRSHLYDDVLPDRRTGRCAVMA
ncbi:MAG: hypothetical protein M3443_04690 [Actinomycetota bacterium]|nr:hypothetical protein [Actinomycetota bacterium]